MPQHGHIMNGVPPLYWDAGKSQYVRAENLGPAPAPGVTSQPQEETEEQQAPPYNPPGANGEVRVLMPDRSIRVFRANEQQDMDAAIRAGAVPLGSGGQPMNVEEFQGGLLVNGMPLNMLLGGNMTPEQTAALQAAGRIPAGAAPAVSPPVAPNAPGTTQSLPPGYTGNPGAAAGALPQDLQDALRQLIQESRTQGLQGQQALTGITGDYKNFLDYQRGLSEQTSTKRNDLVNSLLGQTNTPRPLQVKMPDGTTRSFDTISPDLEQIFHTGGQVILPDGSLGTMSKFQDGWLVNGNMPLNVVMGRGYVAGQREALLAAGITPADPLNGQGGILQGIQSAMSTMNDATGLSPQAMAALRQQATEGPQRDYQAQVEQLKTTLAGRGAYGGGEMPGSLGDIVRGYAPLMGNRDATRSNLLSQTILADEQRKFDTLGLNRNTAAQFGNIGAGLTTGLANAFNPADYSGGQSSALSGLLNATNAGTAAAFQGTASATELLRILQDMEPSSFRNTLYAALLSTGLGAVSRPSSTTNPDGTTTTGPSILERVGDWAWDGIKWVWDKATAPDNSTKPQYSGRSYTNPSGSGVPQAPTNAPIYNAQQAAPPIAGMLPPMALAGPGPAGYADDSLSGGSNLLSSYLNSQQSFKKPQTAYNPLGGSITY